MIKKYHLFPDVVKEVLKEKHSPEVEKKEFPLAEGIQIP